MLEQRNWITFARDDWDAIAALMLRNSLCQNLTRPANGAIVVTSKVSKKIRQVLATKFDHVMVPIRTKPLHSKDTELLLMISMWDWSCESGEAVFIHPNALCTENCDDLFKIGKEFGRVANAAGFPTDLINTLFVLEPNVTTAKYMLEHFIGLDLPNLTVKQFFDSMLKLEQFDGMRRCETISDNLRSKITNYESGVPEINGNENGNLKTSLLLRENFKYMLELLETIDSTDDAVVEETCLKINGQGQENGVVTEPISNGHTEKSSSVTEDDNNIAVIGLSCRFPGANNEEEFWDILIQGIDATQPLPPQRYFTKEGREELSQEDDTNRPAGYLKCAIDEFDAKFFEKSPREAEFMDPQQRLLLEVSWESLENAGINPQKLHGSNTAVFVGMWAQEYGIHIRQVTGDTAENFQHKYLGNAFCASSARISHFLGLRGPSIVMEAGCASALEALHYACDSLIKGETNLAISCGVNIVLNSSPDIGSLDSFILSKDGKCKTFDESANGFARGEGCVSLVLKRVSDALQDNDKIWGIIRGSAVNHDGAGSSLGTPNSDAQSLLLKKAIENSGIGIDDVTYVECHGTGTPVGDPIEVHALNTVFAKPNGGGSKREQPLLIGSVKTNVGHTEGTSGLTGLVKVLLSMKYKIIPRHLNLNNLNPYIDLDKVPIQIPLENTEWKSNSPYGLVAGISSFGLSGTNVHVVVQDTPNHLQGEIRKAVRAGLERPSHIFAISAKSEAALENLLELYQTKLQLEPEIKLADLAYSTNTTRAHFRHRIAVIANDTKQLVHRLAKHNYLTGKVSHYTSGLGGGQAGRSKVAFLFTGQGSQYLGMAKQLYFTQPVFKSTFDKCNGLMQEGYGMNLASILSYDDETGGINIDDSIYSQPAIFCIGYCLCELWKSFGIEPDFVLGHSVGEFAAAVCCGVLNLEDGLKLVVERSRLIKKLDSGRMLVVRSSKEKVIKLIKEFESSSGEGKRYVDIAAVNSTEEIVVAGTVENIKLFEDFCRAEASGIKIQLLAAKHAFHSREMDKILKEYEVIVQKVYESSPAINSMSCRFISSVFAREMQIDEFNVDYWLRHARQPVNFVDAFSFLTNKLLDNDLSVAVIEIGAQPVLLALGMDLVSQVSVTTTNYIWCPSVRKTEENWTTILTSIGRLYTNGGGGVNIDWDKFDSCYNRERLTNLPNYPFQRERYWIKPKSLQNSLVVNSKSIHPFVGKRIPTPLHILYCNIISLDSMPFIKDHKVVDRIIVPCASYLEAILAAGQDILSGGGLSSVPLTIEDLKIEAALPLVEDNNGAEIRITFVSQTAAADENDIKYEVGIHMQTSFVNSGSDAGKWKKIASAKFVPCASIDLNSADKLDLTELRLKLKKRDSIDEVYEKIDASGINFGPSFKSIKAIWHSNEEFLVETDLPEDYIKYVVHPIIVDAMIQANVAALFLAPNQDFDSKLLYLPVAVKKFVNLPRVQSSKLFIYTNRADSQCVCTLLDENGAKLCILEGLDLVPTTRETFLKLLDTDNFKYPSFYEENWNRILGPNTRRIDFSFMVDQDTQLIRERAKESFQDVEGLYKVLLPALQNLCYLYIKLALVQLGWDRTKRIGNTIFLSEFIEVNCLPQKHYKLLDRWLDILVEEGDLEFIQQPGEYKIIRQLPKAEDLEAQISSARKFFVNEYDTCEYKFSVEFGEQLTAVVQGNVSPFSLLFPETSGLVGAAGIYRAAATEALHASLARYLTETVELAVQAKSEYVLRVLEIGAGTGSATEAIINGLEQSGISYEYTMTDISKYLMKEAAEKFAKYKNMKFLTLDIENDPVAQGFPPNYYDCVVADNILHATKDLNESVTNICSLLAPFGQFFFVELISQLLLCDISFAFLDGWWRFTDYDLRPKYQWLTPEGWKSLLLNNNFTNIQTSSEGFNFCYQLFGAVLDSRPINISHSEVQSCRNSWLVFGDDNEEFTRELVSKLSSVGRSCLLAVKGSCGKPMLSDKSTCVLDPFNSEHFKEFLKEKLDGPDPVEGIIYSWGIEKTDKNLSSISDQSNIVGLLHLMQAISNVVTSLIIVTKGGQYVIVDEISVNPEFAILWGLTQAFNNEYPSQGAIAVDIDPDACPLNSAADVFHQLWLKKEKEYQVAFRNRNKYIKRIIRAPHPNTPLTIPNSERFMLQNPTTGSFSDFTISCAMKPILNSNEVEVAVRTAALNFKDVLVAMNTGQDTPANMKLTVSKKSDIITCSALGIDFAGVITAVGSEVTNYKLGDRVYGITSRGSLQSHVVANEKFLMRIPHKLSFEEAATIPCVFITAFYFLITKGKLKSQDKILIHVASGGVGLAAIQLAQSLGCEIFATAGSKRKRCYLKSTLGLKYVYNSRDLEFGKEIMRDTNGYGIDVVLNALTGPNFKETTLSICSKNARFLEMSKLNIWTNDEINSLRPDVEYFIQDLENLNKDVELRGILGSEEELLENIKKVEVGIENANLIPLPFSRFTYTDLPDAFGYLQKAKHIGKVVINMPIANKTQNGNSIEHKEPLFNCYSTYLITGGLGGIGMEVAKWMASSGAKYLVLVGRNIPTPRAEAIISELQRNDVNILAWQGDVSDLERCKLMLSEINRVGFPPLKGIMHAAGSLSNELIAAQTIESFSSVLAPKVQGTLNLHNLTIHSKLEHFVLFSSVVSVVGGIGQCNHAAANKFMDTFAQYRVAQGLPCISINWGGWDEVGVAAQMHVEGIGLRKFSVKQGIASLERTMISHKTNLIVADIIEGKIFLHAFNTGSLFNNLNFDLKSGEGKAEFEKRVKAVINANPEDRYDLIKEFLEYSIRDTLKLPESEPIDHDQDIREIGIDSLMAMELRGNMQGLLDEFNIQNKLNVQLLQENRTINKLARLLTDTINGRVLEKELTKEEFLALVMEDSILSDEILNGLSNCKAAVPPSQFKTILITGVTGYFGAFLLKELLDKRPELVVYALIRAKSYELAKERLEEKLDEFELESVQMENVKCIAGDFTSVNFGLTEETYLELVNEVDAVIHCAALVNHVLPYSKFSTDGVRNCNVLGLLNILKFVTTNKLKYLHHLSSIGAITYVNEETGELHEDFPSSAATSVELGVDSLKMGYLLSKFIGETLLKQAYDKGVPITVLRHHYLGGNSQTGQISIKRDHIIKFMMTCQKIGMFPELDKYYSVTFVPVDIAAMISMKIFLNDLAELGVYNINNSKPRQISELQDYYHKRGYKLEIVPYEIWRKAAIQSSEFAPLAEVYPEAEKLTQAELFSQHGIIKQATSHEAYQVMFKNSEKLKKYVPEIDDIMPDLLTQIHIQMNYYESIFGNANNLKAIMGAADLEENDLNEER